MYVLHWQHHLMGSILYSIETLILLAVDIIQLITSDNYCTEPVSEDTRLEQEVEKAISNI